MWHPNPEITALMNQACSMISTKEAAVPILNRVIELEPTYYEVKLRPVLHQYSDAHEAKSPSMQRISAVTCFVLVCTFCKATHDGYLCMQYIGCSLPCFLQFDVCGVTCVFHRS